MADAGLAEVPATPVAGPAGRDDAPDGSPPPQRPADPRGIEGIDLEELARRLLDPLGRLLRADLRRDRERAGRLYGGRR
ncbi:hypothetical protein [Streptomyces qinglanensis]|uniref:hypothetical protein n=1 Tax=Streptomyces qinglanensis TaxID=943816 RepID=UPI003D73B14A